MNHADEKYSGEFNRGVTKNTDAVVMDTKSVSKAFT